MQTCSLLGRIHIKNERPTRIHSTYVMHIVIIKTEICNIVVLTNPFLMHGFRDGAYPLLGQPAQYHLGRGLAIALTNTLEDRIVENAPTTLSQGRPGHGCNPLLGHARTGLPCAIVSLVMPSCNLTKRGKTVQCLQYTAAHSSSAYAAHQTFGLLPVVLQCLSGSIPSPDETRRIRIDDAH